MPVASEVLRVSRDPDVDDGLGWGSLLAPPLGVCVPGLMVECPLGHGVQLFRHSALVLD